MPLSEHEQRLLEQMERALYAEDPKFASSLRQSGVRQGSRKRLILGVLVVLGGLALLVAGVAVKIPLVGVLGFVVMLTGAFVAASSRSAGEAVADDAAAQPTQQAGKSQGKQSGGRFMGRMEDRWRQRHEGDTD